MNKYWLRSLWWNSWTSDRLWTTPTKKCVTEEQTSNNLERNRHWCTQSYIHPSEALALRHRVIAKATVLALISWSLLPSSDSIWTWDGWRNCQLYSLLHVINSHLPTIRSGLALSESSVGRMGIASPELNCGVWSPPLGRTGLVTPPPGRASVVTSPLGEQPTSTYWLVVLTWLSTSWDLIKALHLLGANQRG